MFIALYFYLLSLVFFSVETETSKELIINSENLADSILPGFIEISRYDKPSMEQFYREIFMPKVPALLEGNVS